MTKSKPVWLHPNYIQVIQLIKKAGDYPTNASVVCDALQLLYWTEFSSKQPKVTRNEIEKFLSIEDLE